MEFTESHKDWTVEAWKRVIWSDETKNQSFGMTWEEMGVEKARRGVE